MLDLRYANDTFQAILSQMVSIFNITPSNRTSRLFQIAFFPTIVMLMAVHHLHTSSTTSKWIHSCSSLLVGMVAIYLTLVVLVECTVRVILHKFGIQMESTTTTTSNPNHRCFLGRKNAALDRCIERSLVQRKFETCSKTNTTTNNNSENATTIAPGACCSICLEEFKPGDTVVSGRKACCKSNVFHEACIQKWLRINDSCPCCRSPMLEQDEEPEPCHAHKHEPANFDAAATISSTTSDSTSHNNNNNNSAASHIRHFWSQFRIRIDTATRLRNEILSYYMETVTGMNDPHYGM